MIRPFSSELYHPEKYRGSGQPCCVCGKPISNEATAHWLMVYEAPGGAVFTNKVDEGDPWFRGGFPVGSNCWRKIRAER